MEGDKSVDSLLSAETYLINEIYATPDWIEYHVDLDPQIDLIEISDRDIKKISDHKSPPSVIAIVQMPDDTHSGISDIATAIYLDDIQDPGNVGTIMRIADWYGIQSVIRSPGSADFYHSKVIQSSMGSFTNLRLSTFTHEELISNSSGHTIITTQMNGTSLQEVEVSGQFILVMGSEGLGVNEELLSAGQLTIGIVGSQGRIAESLNVAVATGIICEQLMKARL